MTWVRHIVMICAVALPAINAQCVAVCAAVPCSQSSPVKQDDAKTPPCHKHKNPKPAEAPQPCASFLLVESRGAVLTQTPAAAPGVVAPALPSAIVGGPLVQIEGLSPETVTSPLIVQPHSTAVLRV